MPITLYHGPAGSGKTDFLLRHLHPHLNSPFSSSFQIIVPHEQAVETYQKKLVGLSERPGLFFCPETVSTFDRFLLSLLKKNLPRVHLIDPLTTRNLLRRLLTEKIYSSFEERKKYAGMIHQLAHTLVQLKRNGLEPVKLRSLFSRHGSPEINDFLNLFDDYQSLCARYSFFDEGELTTATLYLLKKGLLKLPSGLSTLIVDRIFPITHGQRGILKDLAQHHPGLDIAVGLSFDYQERDDPFFYPTFSFLGELASVTEPFNFTRSPVKRQLLAFTDPASEIEGVATLIRDQWEKGLPLDHIGVIVPEQPFYEKRFAEALTSKGLFFSPSCRSGPSSFSIDTEEQFKTGISLFRQEHSLPLGNALGGLAAKASFEERWKYDCELLFSHLNNTGLQHQWEEDERKNISVKMGRGPGGIRLLPLREIYWGTFEFLFVCGFTSSQYPATQKEHLFFTPEMFSDTGLREILEGPVYQWELQRQWMTQVLNRTQRNVMLTYPKILWNGEEQTVSRLLEPLELKDEEAKGSSSPAQKTQPPVTTFPRWYSLHYSLSEFSTYQKCPFKFYAQHHLKLKRPVSIEPDIPGDVAGLFVHKILHRLYQENLDLYREALEYDLYLQRFLETLGPLISQERETIGPLLTSLSDSFVERVLGTVKGMVTEEIDLIRRGIKKTVPKFFEWSFGDKTSPPLRISGNGSEIPVRGRIDRIDVNEQQKIFSVLDYKTGNLDSIAGIKEGRSLQIPVYLMAVGSLLLKGYRPASGLVIGLKEGIKWTGIVFDEAGEENILKKTSRIKPDEWEKLQTETGRRIAEIAQKIRQGAFHPEPASPQECRFCDYRDICHYEGLEV